MILQHALEVNIKVVGLHICSLVTEAKAPLDIPLKVPTPSLLVSLIWILERSWGRVRAEDRKFRRKG